MEEIKVGDYCKDIYGRIGKIKSYSNGTYFTGKFGANSGEIVIHSPNIIDLIQEGDYVNGYRILEKTKTKNNQMQICILKDNNSSNWRTINNETLKSIVTKEMYKSVEYIVGDSNE